MSKKPPKPEETEEIKWVNQSELDQRLVTFIGRNTLAVGYDSTIFFLNLSDGTEIFHKAIGCNGDGVSCIAGHDFYDIFAYAEFSTKPKIWLYSYPQFRNICTLDRCAESRYLSIAFSETEHLIALTGQPDYLLEVWNWRTGKLLVVQSTGLTTDIQYIKCSRSFPLTVAQLASTMGKILFWEIYMSGETATMLRRIIKLPCNELDGPFNLTYALDGSLYLINGVASLYQIYPTSQKSMEIIKWKHIGVDDELHPPENYTPVSEKKQNIPNLLSLYKGGLVVVGSDSVTKYFKKDGNEWKEQWQINHTHPIIVILCFAQEFFMGISRNGIFMQLIDDTSDAPHLKIIKKYDRVFNFIVILNPAGEYLVTINDLNQLKVILVATGNRVASMDVFNTTACQSQPNLPIVALGNGNGTLQLISVYRPEHPTIITEFYLSSFSIMNIQYAHSGSVIVVIDEANDIFVLKGEIGGVINIINHFPLKEKILSLCVKEIEESISITALTVPIIGIGKYSSDYLVQIQIKENQTTQMLRTILDTNYTSIMMLNVSNNEFIGIPFKSYTMEVLEIQENSENDLSVLIKKSIKTLHKLPSMKASIHEDFITTWGLDGLVIVYNKVTLNVITSSLANNHYLGGVCHLVIDPFRQYFITLGHSRNLTCLRLLLNSFDASKLMVVKRNLNSTIIKNIFANKTIGFVPNGDDAGKTWIQIKSKEHKDKERLLYATQRAKILTDLENLKKKLQIIIDKNATAPDDEKLPIQDFNLDMEGAERLNELARLDRETEEKNIISQCIEYNRITEIIKLRTWSLMDVKGKQLRGIFTKMKVENYSLLYGDTQRSDDLEKVKLWRAAEHFVSGKDVFQPWKPKPLDQLELMLGHVPGYNEADEFEKLSYVSGESETSLSNNKYTLTGTTSHIFIKTLPIRYNQMEVITFHQMMAENIMGYHDCLSLRKYFNTKFDEMNQTKENEMNLTKQRNDRLRYIQDELNKLEELKGSNIYHDKEIIDPEYFPDEIPESIVTVEPNELSVTPYISPSQQKLLDDIAAEKERRRLEMLADDFRERALIKMMDGVLEIRWEDEIKKTPTPPDCIQSGKDPKDYTPEDLLAIHEYEKMLQHLYAERERYGNMLVEEQAKIEQSMDNQIQQFNLKVGETLMEKIRVEFAIACEDLKLLRNELFNFERCQFSRKEELFCKEICDLRTEIDNLTGTLNNLEDILLNCKAKYEELSTKDRSLEKQFKTSFSEFASQAVVDQAYRVFRRRPKWQMRAWQTASILQDMARRVNTADTTVTGPPLPEDCFEYLNLIDQVEKFSNAPNLMDQNLWQILCKMRRVKIEIEFKVRSCGALMAEAEATVNAFVKEINSKKTKVAIYDKKLEELKEERNNHLLNRTVQLCMKCGFVEIPLSGRMSDFHNSILLHATDVNDINRIIKKAGMKKLKTMENAAIFRRKIIFKEWEHKVLRMKMAEKKDTINAIEKTKITKEVQVWLKWKQMGWSEDLSQTALNREIDATTKSLENMCRDIIKNIELTEIQILNKKRENSKLDRKIQHLNLDLTEQNMARDMYMEKREYKQRKERMGILVERSRLVREVQQQHAQILELSTMLELQRLRTYPTLNLASINKIEQ